MSIFTMPSRLLGAPSVQIKLSVSQTLFLEIFSHMCARLFKKASVLVLLQKEDFT